MFKNTYQSGFISILYAGGSRPLSIWGQAVKNGHIRRVTDEDVQTLALEIMGTNVATTYIICPEDRKNTLGIRLPFFVMIVKNMKKYFTFEIQILDDKNMSRRFRVSNYQSTTRVRPFSTSLPIGLTGGWNQIQFNLADFTRRAYGSSYIETLRVQIHANVRIRRIYFSDRLYSEDEMPQEFKLYVPLPGLKQQKALEKEQKEKEKLELLDKQTGRSEIKLAIPTKEDLIEKPIADIIPSGAPPTPTGVDMRGEVPAEAAAPEDVAEVEVAGEGGPPGSVAEGEEGALEEAVAEMAGEGGEEPIEAAPTDAAATDAAPTDEEGAVTETTATTEVAESEAESTVPEEPAAAEPVTE